MNKLEVFRRSAPLIALSGIILRSTRQGTALRGTSIPPLFSSPDLAAAIEDNSMIRSLGAIFTVEYIFLYNMFLFVDLLV